MVTLHQPDGGGRDDLTAHRDGNGRRAGHRRHGADAALGLCHGQSFLRRKNGLSDAAAGVQLLFQRGKLALQRFRLREFVRQGRNDPPHG